jgi:integrase
VEHRNDLGAVIADRNAALERATRPMSALEDAAFLEVLARAVDHDLATPDHAPATERAYAHDWADFAAFSERHGLATLPAAPQTLALYLKSLETRRSRSPAGIRAGTAGLALPTLRRRLAAIASRHATAGQESPTDHPLVRKLLRRYSRSRGTAVKKKEPLLIERLPAILRAMPDDLPALRDRALLLLGYAGAFRRSELVALNVEDLRFSKSGLYVWIGAAKNDPLKKGRELYVPRLAGSELCAVAALARWLEAVGPTGTVFRTFDLRGLLTENRLDAGDVARVLRRRAAAGGVMGDFAGHSLRRGFITNAAKKKVPIESIKRVTGQRSSGVVLDYVAAATLEDDPPLLEIVQTLSSTQRAVR